MVRQKKSKRFNEFAIAIKDCRSCNLWKYRRQVVAGSGQIPAKILFMGIAPGKSEDLLGEAFVGESGRLLDIMMKDACDLAGITVPSFFKTNSVLCRSSVQDENSDKYGNNCDPTEEQILACMPKVHKIVKIINPELIIFLGRLPERFYSKEFPEAVELQHPASLLRDGGTESRFYRQNMRKLSEILLTLEQ